MVTMVIPIIVSPVSAAQYRVTMSATRCSVTIAASNRSIVVWTATMDQFSQC